LPLNPARFFLNPKPHTEEESLGLSQTNACDRPKAEPRSSDISLVAWTNKTRPTNTTTQPGLVGELRYGFGMGHKIGYCRVSTTDQDPQLQLDALTTAHCWRVYQDTATGTKADRPEWNRCLEDLRPGDTLVIWKIDRLGRNLRDLVEIVNTLQAREVGVISLTNGIVDTTTAHGKLVFGMFALMSEYEAALIQERTRAGRASARARGRKGGRKPKMTPELVDQAKRMYDSHQFTMAEIAKSCHVTPMTIYRNIRTDTPVGRQSQTVDLAVSLDPR
jgi:DNA invertase Pin-like site-specific DNA recombinase